MNYSSAKAFIISELNKLPPSLTYHGKHHTLDVLNVAESLCIAENMSNHETILILTAALFHDSGFLEHYDNHEMYSCEMARKVLPAFDYTEGVVERICALIMATKIPQTPHDHCAEILCDADLDYLGRADFYAIGQSLFLEMKNRNLVKTEKEWNKIQIRFLESHHFFTKTSGNTRTQAKQEYLETLKKSSAKK